MGLLRRNRPNRLERLLAAAQLDEALARVEPAEPAHIHNPGGGTRYHFQDPDREPVRPVCNASGSQWADGNGGLKECGLCPYMWAQRQASSELEAS